MSAVPAAQFRGWQWVSLLLTAPVASWGAWPLYRVAWRGLGHGTATMDTLVSLGVVASLGWSLYAMVLGGAGDLGMRMQFWLTAGAADGDTIYLEVAAGVTAAVLTGRYLELQAKRRAGGALSALAALGAKTVLVLRDGTEHRVGIGELSCGEQFVVRPGERIGTDTMLAQMARLVGTALASKASAQRLADRVAAVFVPCVIAMAIAALGFWLGAVEDLSEHPVGQAIARAAAGRLGHLEPVTEFVSVPGAGVRGSSTVTWSWSAGRTAVVVGWDARARAVLSVGDALRAGAAEAVAHLGDLGLSPILMTGDRT